MDTLATIVLLAIVVLILAAFAVTLSERFATNVKWAEKVKARTGHDPQDPKCVRWVGDFKGVDMTAVCEPCSNRRAGL